MVALGAFSENTVYLQRSKHTFLHRVSSMAGSKVQRTEKHNTRHDNVILVLLKPRRQGESLVPFFGRPLPLPRRDLRSSTFPLGLAGGAAQREPSPFSLRESPRPESLEEFLRRRRLALALSRASCTVPVGTGTRFPSISSLAPRPSSSFPDRYESPRSSAPVDQTLTVREMLTVKGYPPRPLPHRPNHRQVLKDTRGVSIPSPFSDPTQEP